MENKDVLDAHIDYNRDHNYDYFGFKTLERSYLLRLDGKVAERPQHMLMRVAVGIHHGKIEKALETYDLMSEGGLLMQLRPYSTQEHLLHKCPLASF